MGKLGDFLKLEDGREYVPRHVERKPNGSSSRGNSSGLGRAVLSLLITLFGGCAVCLSIVGITGWGDWGFLAPDTGGHPTLGLDLFTLIGPFAWVFPLVLSLAVSLFGLHLLADVVKDTVRRRPCSREDTNSVMSHPQQEVTPSGHAPKQEPRLAKCPFCRRTTFRVVKEAGIRRCSECHSVLPSYIQGNK